MTVALTRAVAGGLALGLAFDPLAAAVGGTLAAVVGVFIARRGGSASWWAFVASLAWLIGDGLAIAAGAVTLLGSGHGLLGAAAPAWAAWTLLAVWAVSGLTLGYLVPAGVGVAVGCRVRFGTGWLAAGAVALSLVLALTILGEAASSALRPFFGG